jgi:hypothetical protein
MIRSHGGGDVAREQRGGAVATGMLVSDTMTGMRMPVHMKNLEYLVSNTTGVPLESPVLEGVLTATVQGVPYASNGATTPLMMSHEKFATAPQMKVYGQVPFAEGKGQVKGHSAPKPKSDAVATKVPKKAMPKKSKA